MKRSSKSEQQGDYKNALPWEVTDHPDSGMPRELRTQADKEEPLSRPDADAAGISLTPEVVYGEADEHEIDEDERDAHRAAPDEHL
jgi:hypothetical protein